MCTCEFSRPWINNDIPLAHRRSGRSHFAKPWIDQIEKEVFDDEMLFDIPRLYISQLAHMLPSL